MSKHQRDYFRVERYDYSEDSSPARDFAWRIVSIAGGDVVADNIPSADLAEAARKGMEDSRK